ncbi:hypothetical protein P9112_008049 [Eukaryota sp. TZLM1-RC]
MLRQLYRLAQKEDMAVHIESQWTVAIAVRKKCRSMAEIDASLINDLINKFINSNKAVAFEIRIMPDNIFLGQIRELEKIKKKVQSRNIAVEVLMDLNKNIYAPDLSSWSKWASLYSSDHSVVTTNPSAVLAGEFFPVDPEIDVQKLINKADIVSQEISTELFSLLKLNLW